MVSVLLKWKICCACSWIVSLMLVIYVVTKSDCENDDFSKNMRPNVAKCPSSSLRSYLPEVLPLSSADIKLLPYPDSELCNKTKNGALCTAVPLPKNSRALDGEFIDTLYGNHLVEIYEEEHGAERGVELTLSHEKTRNIVSVDDIAQGYQQLFEHTGAFSYTNFLGVPLQQDPSDAFAIMDLIWRLKPDLLIEMGTGGGGSAFFYASIMSAYSSDAHIITMDPKRDVDWNEQRVNKVCPHCTSARSTNLWKNSGMIHFFKELPANMLKEVDAKIAMWKPKVVLVMDDSNHLTDVVYDNIRLYHKYVTPGSYLIVQDMKLSRLLPAEDQASPQHAVKKFLESTDGKGFEIDRSYEYYLYTQHARGFLKKTG